MSEVTRLVKSVFSSEITEAALAELRQRYPSDLVFDMTDDAVFSAARKVRTERNKLVEAINRKRIDFCAEVKTHGDNLVTEINKIYDVSVKPFELEDERRKKIEADKKALYESTIAAERKKIKEIGDWVSFCVGKSSDEIQNVIEAVDMIDAAGFHKDVIHEAIEVKTSTLSLLGQSLSQVLQNESAAKAQAEAELKLKIEQSINRLKMLPMDYMTKTSVETRTKIEELKSFVPTTEKFGNRLQEAVDSIATVIQQLGMIANQAEAMEKLNPAPAVQTVAEEVKTQPDAIGEAKTVLNGGVGNMFSAVDPTLSLALDSWCNDYAITDEGKVQLFAILNSFGVDV